MKAPSSKPCLASRRGSVLLLVLVVVAVLTLGTATYLELMQNERRAVRHHGRGIQATRLAESGVEYLKTVLALTDAELVLEGGLASNPALMQAVLIDQQPSAFDTGRVTILAPAQVDGLYAGLRYGLENESAKLNLNVLLAPGAEDQATARLMAIPGMAPETADAILDWLDADDTLRPNGAERETYGQLSTPYAPRNGPITALDELLLVRGVTPELLYGLDQNHNMLLDANEQPRGLLLELDNADGALNRGWSAYLTVSSVEALRPSGDAAPVDLNGQNLQQLYTDLGKSLDDAQAKFIIVFRQYGAQAAAQEGDDRREGQQNEDDGGATGRPPVAGGQGRNQRQVTVDAASLELNFEQQGGVQLNSPLDLVGATVQVPGVGDNAPPQTVESPWKEGVAAYRDLLDLYDIAGSGSAQRVAGRVNVNAASRPVLHSIPGLPARAVGQIVSRRELEPDLVVSEQRHALWLLIDGIVTLEEMKRLERFITTRGDVYSGQAAGFFDAGPIAARAEFVLDRSGTTPRLRAWRDLSSLGRGYTAAVLGAQGDTP